MPGAMSFEVVAHRGLSSRFPENSRSAVAAALDSGADGVEVDIRLSADEVPVCWHDATLERVSDGTGRLEGSSAFELRSLRLTPPPRLTDVPIFSHWRYGTVADQVLLLPELVSLAVGAGRDVALHLEIKALSESPSEFWRTTKRSVDAAVRALESFGWSPGSSALPSRTPGRTVTVQWLSFEDRALQWLHVGHGVVPERLTVLIGGRGEPEGSVSEKLEAVRNSHGVVAGLGDTWLSSDARHWSVLEELVAAGGRVSVWTVDDPERIAELVAAGARSITTDSPEAAMRLRRSLAAAGDAA